MRMRAFLVSCAVLSTASAAWAINGPNPATPTPPELFGELQATDVGTFPPERDQSDFSEFSDFYYDAHLFMAIRAAGTRLFVAENWGLSLWDVSTPASPMLTGRFDYYSPNGFGWKVAGEAAKQPVLDMALASAGDVALLAAADGMGPVIVETSSAVPFVRYQNTEYHASSALVVETPSKRHGLFVEKVTGVRVYDLDAAQSLPTICVEGNVAAGAGCGVYLGTGYVATFVNPNSGATQSKQLAVLGGVKTWVVTGGLPGFDLWDATNPVTPVHVAVGDPMRAIDALAMWEASGATYVAASVKPSTFDPAGEWELRVYDVSALLSGQSATFPSPLVSMALGSKLAPGSYSTMHVSFADDQRPVLSFSTGAELSHDASSIGKVAEVVFDMSNPAAPHDISPPPLADDGGARSYFGHIYQYGWVRPRGTVVVGHHLYRAAQAVLDVHEWTPPPAVVDAGVDGGSSDGGLTPSDGGTTEGGSGGAKPTPPAEGDEGCGCRAAGESRSSSLASWLVLGLAVACLRRLRARREC